MHEEQFIEITSTRRSNVLGSFELARQWMDNTLLILDETGYTVDGCSINRTWEGNNYQVYVEGSIKTERNTIV